MPPAIAPAISRACRPAGSTNARPALAPANRSCAPSALGLRILERIVLWSCAGLVFCVRLRGLCDITPDLRNPCQKRAIAEYCCASFCQALTLLRGSGRKGPILCGGLKLLLRRHLAESGRLHFGEKPPLTDARHRISSNRNRAFCPPRSCAGIH